MVNAHKVFIDTDHGSWDSAGGQHGSRGLPCSTWARAEWIWQKNCSTRLTGQYMKTSPILSASTVQGAKSYSSSRNSPRMLNSPTRSTTFDGALRVLMS